MSHSLSSVPLIRSNAVSESSRGFLYCSALIHVLDDDSLLNIFYFCRPALLDEEEVEDDRILQGGEWVREHWWYKLAHVCRRWRCLVLASASHLGLCLVCTYGTPVGYMLANSPPFPLIIDYLDKNHKVTAAESYDEGIQVALQHRDRVRRIRLSQHIPNLQNLIMAINDEFPILEYLYIKPLGTYSTGPSLVLPTLQAPHLRHLILRGFALPTTTAGLVTLSLTNIYPETYFPPNHLLRRLSVMPLLETLIVDFHSPTPSHDIERQLLHAPITTDVILPNLRSFRFKGTSAYLEALLRRIITPLLERLYITFFNQLTFSIPHLLQFLRTTEHLEFKSATIGFFDGGVDITVHPREGASVFAFNMRVICPHLDWQIASVAQISHALREEFSGIEDLTLEYWGYFRSSQQHHEADRTQWRELLMLYDKVKIFRLEDELVWELSRSLQLADGESSMELLPRLQELSYSGSYLSGQAFSHFLHVRRNAGHPITLVRREINPSVRFAGI